MVIDSSAIVAILSNEPDAPSMEVRIDEDQVRIVSAVTVFEAAIVLEGRLGEEGGLSLDHWLARIGAEILPVDAEYVTAARSAWRRFGKGRHPASLNFGDCFSYALAEMLEEPLLFKGDDFSKTDIEAA